MACVQSRTCVFDARWAANNKKWPVCERRERQLGGWEIAGSEAINFHAREAGARVPGWDRGGVLPASDQDATAGRPGRDVARYCSLGVTVACGRCGRGLPPSAFATHLTLKYRLPYGLQCPPLVRLQSIPLWEGSPTAVDLPPASARGSRSPPHRHLVPDCNNRKNLKKYKGPIHYVRTIILEGLWAGAVPTIM